ncbi:MAG TPA: S1/P1 nuclease, partial [Flavisolibacter sp.]|nr:S1/P1 nuclease [Flavisolibacter sp.]
EYRNFINSDTTPNAYNRLLFLSRELKKKNLSREKKAFYLKLLIHIAEDISQPLHVSATGTRGGNDVKVQWFSTNTNLHSLWDSHMIEHQQLSYTEYIKAINFTTAAQRQTWQSQPLSYWLYDSYVIAQKLHDEIKTTNPRLGYEYNYKHLEMMNQQLVKGGVRLAKLLNDLFG